MSNIKKDPNNVKFPIAQEFFAEIWRALGGDEAWLGRVRFHGEGAMPSPWAVTDFAAATSALALFPAN